MVEAPGIRSARRDAEATRRRLMELGVLRTDLDVARNGDDIWFPVVEGCGPGLPTTPHTFIARTARPTAYVDLLPERLRAPAPRAFEQMGDIAIIKIPPDLIDDAETLGDALRRFTATRAVFHDDGVVGGFRVRALRRIAGEGPSETVVNENGVRLHVDPARAYYSPRLAHERERIASLVRPGEHVVDLFGGVAPFGIQCAKRGATVDSVDLNPAAIELARRNVQDAGVAETVLLHLGDAREVAANLAPADRVVMNLPHGAAAFLDAALPLVRRERTDADRTPRIIHLHEILPTDEITGRAAELATMCDAKVTSRTVRNYAAGLIHAAFDIEVA